MRPIGSDGRKRITPNFDFDAAIKEQIAEQNLTRFTIGLKPLTKFEGNEKGGAISLAQGKSTRIQPVTCSAQPIE